MVSKENNKPNANDVSYKNAKVVLLGDSGVGKTALGIALTGQPFTLTEPTHGRNIWLLDHSIIHFDDGREETREILLWDFAGQPGYRLINQLYLNNVDIALVVFDAFAETDPLASVRYWNDALNIAQRLENRSPRSLRKFLISVRMDRGSRSFSHSSIDALVRELGCDDYFETSAKEGRGIAELSGSIRETIDWQAITAVQSVQLFQQVATFLNVEKDTSQVLTAEANLYNMFLKSQRDLTGTIELKANFATCIQRAETQGLVQKLAFANLVLLRPELIDIHTSALLNAVRDNPNELGSIAEESVRARNSFVAEDEHLQDQEQEKLFITALIEEFLRREIALREQSEDGPYLIFPSLVSRVAPDLPEPEGKTTIFNFEGPVLNIYTTLIVRLSHHQMFKKPRFWRNAAIYTARAGGTCGILLRSLSEEHGELTLFFDKKASEETRFTFEDFVKTHLMPRAVPSTIQRKRIFMCSTCGTRLDDLQVTRRQERGFNWIICNVCDTIVSILDAEDRLDIVPSSRSLVLEMDPIADSKRDREIIESIVQGKREIGDFDVFLYCNSQDRSAVKQIARQLMTRGILPWFDEWEVRPGQAWQHQVQRQIEQIKSAAVFVGRSGIGPWQQMEMQAILREFVAQGKPVIPVFLQDAPKQLPKLPVFLVNMGQVDFRKSYPNPMELLIWGITGRRSSSDIEQSSGLPSLSLQESDALLEINEIRLAIGEKFPHYRRLARTIIRRMGIDNPKVIENSRFASGTLWEIILPKMGLQLDTQKAILFLRQREEEATCYKTLIEMVEKNAFIIVADITEGLSVPRQTGARTIWLSPSSLIEMVETADDQIPGWLGRFIMTQVDLNVKYSLLPYGTHGATRLFFGREYELTRLTGENQRGGIIVGAHQSGKSSLLREIGKILRQRNLTVIGPLTLSKDFLTFFERTLEPLHLAFPAEMTPASWAAALRTYSKKNDSPVFLLDEVDDLLTLDEEKDFELGREMRSLQSDGHCGFYLAGHAKLREAISLEYKPFKNFAEEVTLTGLTEMASMRLIQEPMRICFNVSDAQAYRIFKGTAGVAVLIQDFCIRLISVLPPDQRSKPEIEDSAFEKVEQNSSYLDAVYYYYQYAQKPKSKCVMLIAAMHKEVTRQDIMQKLKDHGITLKYDRLDKLLSFLVKFGVLAEFQAGHYKILSKYLRQAILARDPELLLGSLLEEKQEDKW